MKTGEPERIETPVAGAGAACDAQRAGPPVHAGGRVPLRSEPQSPLADRLAEDVAGLDVGALLPGIETLRRARQWIDRDRHERTACAETIIGDMRVAAAGLEPTCAGAA